MRARKLITTILMDAAMLVTFGIVFIVPFIFILLNAAKTRQEAALLQFSWPSEFQLW